MQCQLWDKFKRGGIDCDACGILPLRGRPSLRSGDLFAIAQVEPPGFSSLCVTTNLCGIGVLSIIEFGRGGIRTPVRFPVNCFQDSRDRPLCHSSVRAESIILTYVLEKINSCLINEEGLTCVLRTCLLYFLRRSVSCD